MDPGLWRDRIILDEFIVIVHSIEWDVSLLTLYGCEFTFSTQLLTLSHLLTFPPTQHHSFFRNLPHLFIYHEASLRIGSEKPGFQAEWWSFANSILSVRPLIFPKCESRSGPWMNEKFRLPFPDKSLFRVLGQRHLTLTVPVSVTKLPPGTTEASRHISRLMM